MSISLKNYKVLGYTTDFGNCECCGRTDLKGTVSMMHLDSEVVCHFGTSCAASIDKYDTLEAASKAKKEISSAVRRHKELQQFGWSVAWKILRRMYGKDAHLTAPKSEIDFYVNDCEKFYTNPDNKFKAYQHPSLVK